MAAIKRGSRVIGDAASQMSGLLWCFGLGSGTAVCALRHPTADAEGLGEAEAGYVAGAARGGVAKWLLPGGAVP